MKTPAASMERPELLSAAQVRAFRLSRHHLVDRAPRMSLIPAVSDVCGIQAQVSSAANLSARARVEQLSPQDVGRSLWSERSLVRTWCLRSTVHLVSSNDLPMLAAALSVRAQRGRERWAAARRLTSGELAAVVRDAVEALDDAPATYAELRNRIVVALPRRAARTCDQTAIAQLVQIACVEGMLVSGPTAGPRTTFVRSERWCPGSKRMSVREAQDALLRRYLHSYAPATLHDFASWSGLAVGDAQPVWDRLVQAGEMVDVTVNGNSARLIRGDLSAIRAMSLTKRHVRLLPAFDIYLLAHRDKSLLVSSVNYGRIYRKAARVSPVLLVDGCAAGIWSCTTRGSKLRLRVEPLGKVPKAVRAGIDREAADISRFLGVRVELEFGRIASPSFVT